MSPRCIRKNQPERYRHLNGFHCRSSFSYDPHSIGGEGRFLAFLRAASAVEHKAFVRSLLAFISAVFLAAAIFGCGFRVSAQDESAEVSYKYFTSVRIEQGDTLWTLADVYADENFDSKIDFINEVIRTNHLTDETLQAGDHLIIPYYSAELKR